MTSGTMGRSANGVDRVIGWVAAAVVAGGGLASAAFASGDCNNNGIPDHIEIAQGLLADCNGNGIPDICEYAGVEFTAVQAPFGAGVPLTKTLAHGSPAASDVRITVTARADLAAISQFVQVRIAGTVVGSLWVVGGQSCSDAPLEAMLLVPAATFNGLAVNGSSLLSVEASPTVSAAACAKSIIEVRVQYVSQRAMPDLTGSGVWDACEIASGVELDCNSNGIPDSVEVSADWFFEVDCDGDGVPDSCQIAANPSLDANGDGILDSCQYAQGDFNLDGVVDGADLSVLLALWGLKGSKLGDLTGDGLVDGADLAVLLGNWGVSPRPWGEVLEFDPDPTVVTSPTFRSGIPATGLPWRVRDNASQIEMLLVPPGTFMMGCSPSLQWGCWSDENPVHQVTLTQPFYLGRYEVTQAQWTAVMGSNPSSFQSPSAQVPADQVPNRPVERVSWNMIQSFNAATGLRLPTEAEWEYACRAGTTTAFNLPPNGTDDDGLLGQLAWFLPNAGNQTRPVGQKLPNALGLHDMHGNVWEWVQDWHGASYYSQSPGIDPPGPISGTSRVLRGGSWIINSYYCRASYRGGFAPGYVVDRGGFRAARTP